MEIIKGFFNNQWEANKENLEEWIDLIGNRTVWLKIHYNQKYIPPVTHLEFLYMPFDETLVLKFFLLDFFNLFDKKIPVNLDCFPVPVKKHKEKGLEHRFMGTQYFDKNDILLKNI